MECLNNILLVSANRFRDPYPVYPIGVSYLKSYLKKSLPDYTVKIFDCNLGTMDDLKSEIHKTRPKYTGVSLRNVDGANSLKGDDFLTGYKEITDVIRENTDAPLIIGGSAFSMFPQQFMAGLNADYGIAGEGEESLTRLIKALDEGTSPEKIDGILLRNGTNGYKPGSPRHYVRSLDLEFDDHLVGYYWKHSGMLNIQTKRGCPYNCVYCSYPVIDGRTVRTLDADRIIDNVSRLKRDKGIDYLFFTDSVFNICPEYNHDLAEKLIKSELNIRWGAYFSPANITDEMLALYKRSGLTHIEFGTESFSDSVLASYRKPFSYADVLKASQLCLRHNIYYSHFLILGGLGETSETIAEGIKNSLRIEYSVFFPYIGMRIYPHTGLHQIAVAEGIADPANTLFEPVYYTSEGFDLEKTRSMALATGKAWVFPDDPGNKLMEQMRINRNKKGLLWEYLRKP